MIIVHHLEHSRSQRVLWLLEELGLEYEVKLYKRDKKTSLAPPELKDVHPLGKSPVVEIDGVVVAETGPILEYIIDTVGGGRMRPEQGAPEYLKYRYWLHYAEGSAFPPLLLKLITTRMASAPMPFFAKPIARSLSKGVQDAFINPQLKLHFDFIESELAASSWFAGEEISAADVIMSFPLEAMNARGEKNEKRPYINAFLERIHARPAYQKALQRGGPYAILGG
ncbi:MAG: glutathione S-transferase [Pseudomonadota bacterium]